MGDKKTFLISIASIFVVGCFLALSFWFLWGSIGLSQPQPERNTTSNPSFGSANECVSWQSEDSSKPCYRKLEPSPTVTEVDNACGGLSTPETEECITQIAVLEKSDVSCGALSGFDAQKRCSLAVIKPINDTSVDVSLVNAPIPPLVAPTKIVSPTVPVKIVSSPKQSTSKPNVPQEVANTDPSNLTAEAFLERMVSKAPLRLFQVMPYQVKPGSDIVLTGFGFQKTANVIHIGSITSSSDSVDGMTLKTTLPDSLPEGVYDVYVTNSRGSTNSFNPKVEVVVTNNPQPLPVITSVTPEVASPYGSVTISGENLTNVKNYYFSLGSTNGSSNTIPLKSLQYMDRFTESPYVEKGSILTFTVRAKTDAGLSEPFAFKVQF